MMHGNAEDEKASVGDDTARAGIFGTPPVRASSQADAEPNRITSAFLVAFTAQRSDVESLVDAIK